MSFFNIKVIFLLIKKKKKKGKIGSGSSTGPLCYVKNRKRGRDG
jgi:hypothetical protein